MQHLVVGVARLVLLGNFKICEQGTNVQPSTFDATISATDVPKRREDAGQEHAEKKEEGNVIEVHVTAEP